MYPSHVETAPRSSIIEFQTKKMRETVAWVSRRSSYWSQTFKSLGLTSEDILTLEDFRRNVPYVTKKEEADDQNQNPPFGSGFLCYTPEEIFTRGAKIWRTSGTTARPRSLLFDVADYQNSTVESGAKSMYMAGTRKGDCVFCCFPLSMWGAGWIIKDGSEKIGAWVLNAVPPLDSKARLLLAQDFHPNIFAGTPSYALHLAELGKNAGLEPSSLGLRNILTAGEVLTESARERLRETYGGAKVFDCLGMSEVTGCVASECEYGGGLHTFEDLLLCDVLEPEGCEAVGPGEVGELVITSLVHKSTAAAFHYRCRDLVTYEEDKCECGRTTRRIRIKGRLDDMVKIRGINVFPSAIEEVIRGTKVLGPEFQLVLKKEGIMDGLKVVVEPLPDIPSPRHAEIQESIKESFRNVLSLRVDVELVRYGTLPRFEGKGKRLVDGRGT